MTSGIQAATSIYFAPYFSPAIMAAVLVVTCILLLASLIRNRKGFAGRMICAAAFLFLLGNPSVIEQERAPVNDVAALIIDRSASQDFLNRRDLAETAESLIKERITAHDHMDIRIGYTDDGASHTDIFAVLDNILADVPQQRRAGAVIITDGQVHDVPRDDHHMTGYGPAHVLLTGHKNEIDRRIDIIEAPAYGLVGAQVTVRYRVIDNAPLAGTARGNRRNTDYATVISRMNDAAPRIEQVRVGEEHSTTVTITHAGQNILNIEVSPLDDEITNINNSAPLVINGVRDRLRVLLVSGKPHAGGRTWRNLLTSDPGVDLVHFTILREPQKIDMTPQNELSLIAFPFRELFEEKLYDFDLIIFDQYHLNRILPHYYFANIAKYVRDGGALLEVSGPTFAGEDSTYSTALRDIFPAAPTGQIYEQSFSPHITPIGLRHPVTQNLPGAGGAESGTGQWGPWLRQIGLAQQSGHVVMSGYNEQPLLILDRVGQGRIAHLGSDQIWLWSRGYKGGGPHAELLRRLSHWLMKEPALEEEFLETSVHNYTIRAERRSLDTDPIDIEISAADGSTQHTTLTPNKRGTLSGEVTVDRAGVYSVSDGTHKRYVIVGALNTPEFTDVVTTDTALSDIVTASNGSIKWLGEDAVPDVRVIQNTQRYGQNSSWIGLRANNSFDVLRVTDRPVLPLWLMAAVMMVLVTGCWWLEGRRRGQ